VGSGLGLPICRNIISEFGGEIAVESELGKGTCFTLRLPIGRDMGLIQPKEPATELPGMPSVRGRILVVDDERAIRTMLVQMLGDKHEVVMAVSGEAAMAILTDDQSFDVILCDLMMPQVTGMELHRWLSTRHPGLAKRVVFVSGGVFTLEARNYIASAGNLRLEKPFNRSQLEPLIVALVAKAHASREQGPERAPLSATDRLRVN